MPPGPPERCWLVNGPSAAHRRPGPSVIAVSTSATVATPRATSEYASRHSAACRRFARWPGSSACRRSGERPTEA